SIVPYAASAGLSAYEIQQRQKEAEHKKYVGRCLPTEEPTNAMFAGMVAQREAEYLKEHTPKDITAYHAKLQESYIYYKIAETLGDERAEARLKGIRPAMPESLIEQADEEFERYTLDNILSCYE